ncbi:hypothetical protein GJAV_G00129820 [Gymnothorax javanicus]|nr:hypothetical protein GJAV_G00129820 [Gymnothorax javanicus]
MLVLIIAVIVLVAVYVVLVETLFKTSVCRSVTAMAGKTVIITGGNTGIGKATAVDLARRGARVILACRNQQRAEAAIYDIKRENRNAEVVYMQLDLGSLKSVRSFTETFLKTEPRLDLLINNAGLVADGRTEDGFGIEFGVNHLGHFLLTWLLLDRLKEDSGGRVVTLSSIAYRWGRVDFDSLISNKDLGTGRYSWQFFRAYCNSKLCNVLFTHELAKRLKDTNVTCYSVHPGIVRTELSRNVSLWQKVFIEPVARLLFLDPVAGAQTTLHCALQEGIEHLSGRYFFCCAPQEVCPNGKDDAVARKLWEEQKNNGLLCKEPAVFCTSNTEPDWKFSSLPNAVLALQILLFTSSSMFPTLDSVLPSGRWNSLFIWNTIDSSGIRASSDLNSPNLGEQDRETNMHISPLIYRCALYTRGLIVKSGADGCPLQRCYHCSVTLLHPDTDGSEVAGRRGRGFRRKNGTHAMGSVSVQKPFEADGWNAAKQCLSKTENQSEQTKPGLGVKSRLSLDLQRLSRDDFDNFGEAQVCGEQAGVRQRTELLFGAAPCLLALTQGRREMRQLFVKEKSAPQRSALQQACDEARRRMVPVQPVSRKELDRLCGGRVHQGLCLEASPLGYVRDEGSVETTEDGNGPPLWLVLEGVQDPMNLGAILRSAYFLGVDRIASSIHNSCPLTPVVSKASSGVMEIVEVHGYENLADMLRVKVEQGWQVIGTVGAAEVAMDVPVRHCSDFSLTAPSLLLIGGEGTGLSPELRQLCHVLLTIAPRRELHPNVESLNVSVATGILVHSLLSSRTKVHR